MLSINPEKKKGSIWGTISWHSVYWSTEYLFSNIVAVFLLFLDILSLIFFCLSRQISRELNLTISVRLLFVREEQPNWHAKPAKKWRLCRQGMAVQTSVRVKEGQFAPPNAKPRSHWPLCGNIAMEKLHVFWEQIIQCLGIRVLEHTSTLLLSTDAASEVGDGKLKKLRISCNLRTFFSFPKDQAVLLMIYQEERPFSAWKLPSAGAKFHSVVFPFVGSQFCVHSYLNLVLILKELVKWACSPKMLAQTPDCYGNFLAIGD